MRKNSLIAITSLTLLVLVVSACGEIVPSFDNTPNIKSPAVRKARYIFQDAVPPIPYDSIIISLSFEDGDGDIGGQNEIQVDQNDTLNFFTTVYKQIDGTPKVMNPTPSFNGILSKPFRDGGKGPIEGTLDYGIAIFPPLESVVDSVNTFLPNDTIYFEVSIRDRAGNRSNIIRTDTVVVLAGIQ